MPEPIGDISVQISGDFSKLDADLAQSVIAAELGGQKIATAFNQAAGGAQTLEQRVGELVSSGNTLAQALSIVQAQDEKVTQSLTEAAKAAEVATREVVPLAKALADFGQSAGDKGKLDALNASLKDFANTAGTQIKPALQGAAESTSAWDLSAEGLLSTLLRFGGVALTIEALKDAFSEAFAAASRFDDISDSLTFLTGSADKAKQEITGLIDLAQDTAMSLPQVLKADQNLRAMGLSAERANEILRAAADTSSITGKSFDAAAAALTRLIEGGAAGSRQLLQLGITAKDLAAVMDVTAGEVTKAFKALDESAKADVALAALKKFKDAAHDTSQDVFGDWQRLRNDAEVEFAAMGDAIAPIADILIQTFRTVGIPVIAGTIAKVKELTDVLVSLGATANTVGGPIVDLTNKIFGLHNTFKDLMSGPLAQWLTLPLNAPIILWEQMAKALERFTGSAREAKAAAKEITEVVEKYSQGARELVATQEDLNFKVVVAQKTWRDTIQMQKDGLAGQDAVNLAYKKYKEALDGANGAQKNHVLSLGELNDKMQEGTAETNKAMSVVLVAQKLDQDSAQNKVLLAEAVKQLTAASKKYSDQITDANVLAIVDLSNTQAQIDKVQALAEAWSILYAKFGSGALVTQEARDQFDKMRNTLGLLPSDLQRLLDGIQPIGPAFKALGVKASEDLAQLAANAHEKFDQIKASGIASAGDLITAWDAWQKKNKEFADSFSVIQTAAHAMGITTVVDLTAQRDKYVQLIADMRASGEGGWDAIRAAMQKVKDLQDQITAAMDPLVQAYKTLGIESAKQMQIDLDRKRAALDLISGTADYQRGLEAVQKQQDKLNDALGFTYQQQKYIGQAADETGKKIQTAFGSGTTAVEQLNSALAKTAQQLNGLQQGLIDMAKHWADFKSNLNVGSEGFTTGGKDFNTGFSIPAHTHLDYSLWGISGARVVPDNGYYFDVSGNVVEADWHIISRGGTPAGSATTASTSAPVAAAPIVAATPAAAVIPPEILYFLQKGATADQIATLSTSTTALDTTMQKVNSTFATLSPAIQTATTQLGEVVQKQTASFQNLTAALAPVSAPSPVSGGAPASFQRTTSTVSTTSSATQVNNVNLTTTPQMDSLIQEIMIELQRRGVRF